MRQPERTHGDTFAIDTFIYGWLRLPDMTLIDPQSNPLSVTRGRRGLSFLTRLALGLWLVLLASPIALASDGDIVARAENARSTVENAAALSDDQKAQANSRLDEAVGFARETVEVSQATAALRTRLDNATTRLADLQAAETAIPAEDNLDDLEPQTATELETALTTQRRETAELEGRLNDGEQRLSELLTRSRADAGELATLQRRLVDLGDTTESPASGEPIEIVDGLWRSARKALTKSRVDLIKLRQSNIELLTELARRERDVTAAQLDAAKQRQSALLKLIQQKRQQDAAAVISAAEQGTTAAPTGLRAVQADISALARERAQLLARESEYERQLDQVTRTLERLKRDYDRIRQIVELGGSSAQVSSLLQKRRQIAPSPERLNREAIDLQTALTDGGLRQLELDEQLQALVDDDTTNIYLQDILGIKQSTTNDSPQADAFRELAPIYRQSALELWQSYTGYLNVVSQLETNTRLLADEAERYQNFINDRLLWVPSTELVPLDDPLPLINGLRWFIDPQVLQHLLTDLVALPTASTGGTLLWLVVAIGLGVLRQRALVTLKRTAEQTQRVRTDRFRATLKALLATVVLLAWIPWLLIGLGLLLGYLPNAANSTLLYAAGLQAAGQVVLFLGTFRHLCRPKGLALAHLHWHPKLCESLARQAAWLLPLATPLGFLTAAGSASVPSDFIRLATSVQIENVGVASVGRLAFAAQMLLLMVAIHRIWRRTGAVISAFAVTPDRSKWASYHILWFGPSLLTPALLSVAALLGYFYSAVFLVSVAGETLWFILTVTIAKDLLLRGLYVTQRRIRFQEALRYRDEQLAQRAAGDDGEKPPVDKTLEAIEEEKVNYNQLGDQVRSLVQLGFTISWLAGLWWIWRDIFPAFSFLDSIALPITTSKLVDGVTQDVSLTLGDMVAGLLLGGLALFAAMKVPAVLELTLLQKLPLSRASRYAFTTLLQYVVAVFGVFITFNALGLQWSSIQWLVAALSVGLGFGLQEIVANFISGIILLFEQPIRVGDIVTVDGTTGTVSKIRIRATTIVNYDRQELIIPNKTFITGQLINWTLSDTVNRVFITVGVSYGTDTRQAMELIRQAADEHPNVLTDPAPIITFEAFGDNALTLNLRAYLGDMEKRLLTISELHQDIIDKFRESDIEISFPQRDVHLTTLEPLELKLQR